MRKATCDNCQRAGVWVNMITTRGTMLGEYCAECFETTRHDEPPRNRTTKSSGTDHNNPWQDNAIRAMEDGIQE